MYAEGVQDHADSGLEALLFECLERLEVEGEAALEAVCLEHPEHASELRESIAALRGAGLVPTTLRTDGDAFPERLGEFRLLRRLGGGGMGVVFLAEQAAVGRDVALKLIRPDQLYFPNIRERFQREIEAIARLSHPGIVQVHSIGEDKGIPFYSMEYIRGISLAEVIAAFGARNPAELDGESLRALLSGHESASERDSKSDERESVFRGEWAQVCVNIARQIARIVEHCHERGVLHRDLKPSNVMLTADGRVVLLDFGLASLMGAGRLTRTGSQLGSLPYMSPEQIRGEVASIGPASDVYAIGVTLYELLTLRPAFEDDTNSEALRREILEGRATRAGHLHRGLSRDLETVVAHAMEAEVNQRYPSARALADDLENILTMRAITARTPTLPERLSRWARRSPARATATALAAILVFGGPSTFAWQQFRSAKSIRAANDELNATLVQLKAESVEKEVQRAAAERNLRKAVAAVDTMLTRVGQDALKDVPQMTPVRRDLLQDALDFYEGFLEEREGDRDLRREVALSRMRVATMRAFMGETAEAAVELARVIDELEELYAQPGADPAMVPILARAHGTLGETRGRLGKNAEGLANIQRAVQLLEGAPPTGADYYLLLGSMHDRLFSLAQRRGDIAEALAQAERAVAVSRVGLAAHPELHLLELNLGRQLDHVGGAHLHRGDAAASLPFMEESLHFLESYRAQHPDDSHAREKLMAARVNTSNTLLMLRRIDEAEQHTIAAIELGEGLVSDFPEFFTYRSGLALALGQASVYPYQRGDLQGAKAYLERAVAYQRQIVDDRPADFSLRAEIALAYNKLSVIQNELGESVESAENARLGLAQIEKVLERSPRFPLGLDVRWSLLAVRGATLAKLGRWRETVALARTLEPEGDGDWIVSRANLLELAARHAGIEADPEAVQQSAALRLEALALLSEGVASGAQDWADLDDPEDWLSLRDDEQFQRLVEEARKK